MSGWSADDDDDWSDEEESTDMGDDDPVVPALAPATIRPRVQSTLNMGPGLSSSDSRTRQKPEGRRVRVKPMPNGMRTKWPDLVSCLMTMANGKQVLLVK